MFGPYLVIFPTSGKELFKKGISLWSIGNTFLLGKVPKHPEEGEGCTVLQQEDNFDGNFTASNGVSKVSYDISWSYRTDRTY